MIFEKHINRYYIKYAYMLIIGLLTLGMVDWLQLLVPNLYQMVINGLNQGYVVVQGQQIPYDMEFVVSRICMPMTGIIIGILFGRFIWRICFFGAAIRVETSLRDRMFDNARRLNRDYYQVNKVGSLMSLFTNDLDTVQDCYGWGIMMFFDALMLSTLSISKMWRMNSRLTLLSMIPMAFLLAASTLVGRYMMKKWDERQECFARLSDFSQESFSGIAVVKAFVKQARELWAFRDLNKQNEKAQVEYTKASVLLRILVTCFVESTICLILGFGGYLVYQDVFNAGQLIEFLGYFTTVVWPIMAVAELVDMTSRGQASMKRIAEMLEAKPTVVDRAGAKPLEEPHGDIAFRHLNFTYPDGETAALQDISFTIHAGENVGLVGRTGSGKSTLVDLILRTYNVPDGSLFIDGQDVNDLTIASVRKACAYVPQDNFLFSDTIENNIGFGVAQQDEAAVSHAARMADIHDNIMEFGAGYETVLGERGVTVSGGQKQRISIARALMKDAPILILDDSVSAVDTRTEQNILHNLSEERAGRTTILIAHRISTIARMDKLLFLEDGRLTAAGTHTQLYETCPAYRRMVDLQRLEEEGEVQNA